MKRHFEKIKSEGTCLHRLDEELINRRREELRSEIFVYCNPADGLIGTRWCFSSVALTPVSAHVDQTDVGGQMQC